MPFDYIAMKSYDVNFDKIKDLLMQSNIATSKWEDRYEYINSWLWLLHDKYSKSKAYYQNSKFLKELMITDDSENFQQVVFLGDEKLLLHFRISYLVKCAKENHIQPIDVPIKNFTNSETNIQYTKTEYIPELAKNIDPIFVVPYFNGVKTHLVVDGNKRLTAKITNKSKSISVILFSVVTTQNAMHNDFERAVHSFVAQMRDAQIAVMNNDFRVLMLLNNQLQSYIKSL